MPSLPLEVHQVLEQEFVSMYGPLERPPLSYDKTQITDVADARSLLRACEIEVEANAQAIAAKLHDIVATDQKPEKLAASPALTDRGRTLLDNYDDYVKLAAADDPEWGARELRRTIVDEALSGAVKALRDVRLDNLYGALHARAKKEQPRTALCVSGGGIRSATFALGLIQGLGSAGMLKRFDYLSTVSGGGYIGSWLSSWVRRHPQSVEGVEEELTRADTAIGLVSENGERKPRNAPPANIDPEPAPVRHLREYSNYLSPRLGLLSGDSWTLASHYLRNLLLNLLVLVPLLALALAIPRFFSWGLIESHVIPQLWYPWIAVIAATVAFAYIGASRPLGSDVASKAKYTNARYFVLVVVPLGIASCALALFWARAFHDRSILTADSTLAALGGAVAGMVLLPWAIYYGRIFVAKTSGRLFSSTSESRWYMAKKFSTEFIAVVVALTTAIALFSLLAAKVFPEPVRLTPDVALHPPYERLGVPSTPQAQLYVCLAVPLALLVFFVQASIFVGLSGRRNEDADREWWARGGAQLLMVSVGMGLFSLISVFGPVALYHAPAILGSIGGVAGIGAALLGFSDKTPANQKQKEQGGTTAKIGNVVSALIVPLFVVFILALISLGSTWLIHRIGGGGIDSDQWSKQIAMQSAYSETARRESAGTTLETKASLPPAAMASLPALRSFAHLDTLQHTTTLQLLLFAGMAAFAFVLSFNIGVNKFSMQALYRNRLIRAYLGASRTRRAPDAFTGFDENDNLQMWELRPELLWKTSLADGFADVLRNAKAEQKLAYYLWNALDPRTVKLLSGERTTEANLDALVRNLNHLIITKNFAVEAKVPEPEWVRTDPKKEIGYDLAFRNRALIDETFPNHVVQPLPRPGGSRRAPLHVINTALNLTTGKNIGWQQRMAESFTVSPFHAGSMYVGYRNAHEYGGSHGISVGTAVTISGAAASPNMGYHSSPAMAFLLTMVNVRLGSWLGNPGLQGQNSYSAAHPTTNLVPLTSELTGGSTDQSKWIYLSDGGHFENLGLYEMVRRRCHYIVVSDGGCDPKYTFEDLGNAIRKIRTDLGVPIEILEMSMSPRDPETGTFAKGRYVARAKIRYGAVDEGGEDGTLIYVKAGIYANDRLPKDVYNYAQESRLFPHEPTSDQFFSESQFESYRALGRHAMNDICASYTPDQVVPLKPEDARIPIAKRFPDFPSFDRVVREYLQQPE